MTLSLRKPNNRPHKLNMRMDNWESSWGGGNVWDPFLSLSTSLRNAFWAARFPEEGWEMWLETDRSKKSCLSSEIQVLDFEEVAQNSVLDRPIWAPFSTDFPLRNNVRQSGSIPDGCGSSETPWTWFESNTERLGCTTSENGRQIR